MIDILASECTDLGDGTITSASHQRAIEDIVQAVKDDLAHPWTIQEMARRASYSPFHFARVFKEVVGEPPGRFVTRLRFSRAKNLLETTPLTVAQICRCVGYAGVGTFSSNFRTYIGQSPAAYRLECETPEAPLGGQDDDQTDASSHSSALA